MNTLVPSSSLLLAALCVSSSVLAVEPPRADDNTKPAVAPPGPAAFPKPHRFTLDPTQPGAKGAPLEVLLVERHEAPALVFHLLVPGGASLERRGGDKALPAGTGGLCGQVMLEGTQKHQGAALSESLERIGASLDVTVGDDAASVTGRVLSTGLDRFLTLMAEVIFEPQFGEHEIESLRERYRAALENQETDPKAIGNRVLGRLLYPDSDVYSSPGLTLATVDAITKADLRAFHARGFRLGGAKLIVVGDVTAKALKNALERTLGAKVVGEAAPWLADAPAGEDNAGCHVVDRPGSVQSTIFVANRAVKRADKAYTALVVANQALGGSGSSRLFQQLREKEGLTYGVYSAMEPRRRGGEWLVRMQVRNEKTEQALAGISREIEKFKRDGLSADELAANVRYIAGTFALSIESPSSVAYRIASAELNGLPADEWQTYGKRLGAVTPAEAVAAAREQFAKQGFLTLVVGSVEATQAALMKACGKLVQRDSMGKELKKLK